MTLCCLLTGPVRSGVSLDPDGVEFNVSVCDGAEEEVPCRAVCSTQAMAGESRGAAVEGCDHAEIIEDVGACGASWGSKCSSIASENL